MQETSKLTAYRLAHGYSKYFHGHAIDIGCGVDVLSPSDWPDLLSVQPYDKKHGDAQTCHNLPLDHYDLVYSSHCLEHLPDPLAALTSWLSITKPFGHIVFAVPHEIFYEKCIWPPHFNRDHKTSWTLEWPSNLPSSHHIPTFLERLQAISPYPFHHISSSTILQNFDFTRFSEDQTRSSAICQIDTILQRL